MNASSSITLGPLSSSSQLDPLSLQEPFFRDITSEDNLPLLQLIFEAKAEVIETLEDGDPCVSLTVIFHLICCVLSIFACTSLHRFVDGILLQRPNSCEARHCPLNRPLTASARKATSFRNDKICFRKDFPLSILSLCSILCVQKSTAEDKEEDDISVRHHFPSIPP